jgi:hypothetical protein
LQKNCRGVEMNHFETMYLGFDRDKRVIDIVH